MDATQLYSVVIRTWSSYKSSTVMRLARLVLNWWIALKKKGCSIMAVRTDGLKVGFADVFLLPGLL